MTGLSLRGIARALGGVVDPSGQVLAPGPGHSPKDRSLHVWLDPAAPDGFIVNSFANNDWRVCKDYVKRRLGINSANLRNYQRPARETRADELAAKREATNRKRAATIASRLQPMIAALGEAYLRDERGIDVAAIADVLARTDAIGWHPAVYFNEPEYPERGDPPHPLHGQTIGAIIGVMTDPVTALPTGAISRTYVHEGHKVAPAKTLGSPAGIIRLSPDEDVLGGLHIAEGIESGLTATARGFRPLWVTGGKGLMRTFPVLWGSRRSPSSPTTTGTATARGPPAKPRGDGFRLTVRSGSSCGTSLATSTTRSMDGGNEP